MPSITKQHIVDEIKRTARANNGTPLGKERFLNESGIKESDWRGRYWVRWTEAVAEAGFSGNKFNAAYADDDLLRPLALLARQLGHLPVNAEMRMRARLDPEFPSDKTFERFGSKRDLAERLRVFAVANDLADVADICAAAKPIVRSRESAAQPEEFGFVYLLRSGRFFKVGKTNAVGRRELSPLM